MSQVVLKGPERHSGCPKKDRNSVPVRSSPIQTLKISSRMPHYGKMFRRYRSV